MPAPGDGAGRGARARALPVLLRLAALLMCGLGSPGAGHPAADRSAAVGDAPSCSGGAPAGPAHGQFYLSGTCLLRPSCSALHARAAAPSVAPSVAAWRCARRGRLAPAEHGTQRGRRAMARMPQSRACRRDRPCCCRRRLLTCCPSAVAVGAIFRDETQYLAEWLEFHLCQGVEHFFLYNHHSSSDDHEAVLAPYVAAGLVTLDDAVCDVHCQVQLLHPARRRGPRKWCCGQMTAHTAPQCPRARPPALPHTCLPARTHTGAHIHIAVRATCSENSVACANRH